MDTIDIRSSNQFIKKIKFTDNHQLERIGTGINGQFKIVINDNTDTDSYICIKPENIDDMIKSLEKAKEIWCKKDDKK